MVDFTPLLPTEKIKNEKKIRVISCFFPSPRSFLVVLKTPQITRKIYFYFYWAAGGGGGKFYHFGGPRLIKK